MTILHPKSKTGKVAIKESGNEKNKGPQGTCGGEVKEGACGTSGRKYGWGEDCRVMPGPKKKGGGSMRHQEKGRKVPKNKVKKTE